MQTAGEASPHFGTRDVLTRLPALTGDRELGQFKANGVRHWLEISGISN
jgi:hypothetical protein